MKIVFIGDSITECGRDKADPQSLGDGYVAILREKLKNLYEDVRFEFLNRGVSHDRVADVQARIQKDVADEHPDICVVLIGVNDVTCRFTKGIEVTPAQFKQNYEAIVEKVRNFGAKLVVLQPFVLKVPEKARYRRFFEPLLSVIEEITTEYNIEHIPLDEYLNGLCLSNPDSAYSPDGIHPTHRASRLIADNLIKIIKKYIPQA